MKQGGQTRKKMHHAAQRRSSQKGGGGHKKAILFAEIIFAKGMQLKIKFFCAYFFARKTPCAGK
jgi:hypothetical protein